MSLLVIIQWDRESCNNTNVKVRQIHFFDLSCRIYSTQLFKVCTLVTLTFNECYYEKRCTNLEEINNAPVNIREHIKAKYGCFFVINAMPIGYMRDKLNITFDL